MTIYSFKRLPTIEEGCSRYINSLTRTIISLNCQVYFWLSISKCKFTDRHFDIQARRFKCYENFPLCTSFWPEKTSLGHLCWLKNQMGNPWWLKYITEGAHTIWKSRMLPRFSVPDIKHLGWVCEHTAFVAISYTPNGFERSDGSMTGLAIVRKGDRRS